MRMTPFLIGEELMMFGLPTAEIMMSAFWVRVVGLGVLLSMRVGWVLSFRKYLRIGAPPVAPLPITTIF